MLFFLLPGAVYSEPEHITWGELSVLHQWKERYFQKIEKEGIAHRI